MVYDFLVAYWRKYGVSPALDDISRGCFLSKNTASRLIDRLEMWGLVSRIPALPRAMRVAVWPDGSVNPALDDPDIDPLGRFWDLN